MNTKDILEIITLGETSKVQFKQDLPNLESIAQEIVAMSNSIGGLILIGIKDVTGGIVGLSPEKIEDYDKRISQAADNLKPPVYIATEVLKIETPETKYILAIHIQEGINKPYKTSKGEIFIKQGANKRLVTDNSEIMRLFQQSANLLADEMEVYGTSIDDTNKEKFSDFFKKEFGTTYEDKGLNLEQALKAKRVLRNEHLTLAGLLFFGKNPQEIKPAFTIKFVSFFGNDISENYYRSKPSDLKGTIPELFDEAMRYLKSCLHHVQKEQGFNSTGILEISEIALIEILQNALLHRDYFKNSPIRILIFDNRVEIISPGKLPNSLTVEEIKFGNPVIRNNQLVSYALHLLPFSGLGSGIKRAISEQPNIELINDIQGEQFKVIIPRPEKSK